MKQLNLILLALVLSSPGLLSPQVKELFSIIHKAEKKRIRQASFKFYGLRYYYLKKNKQERKDAIKIESRDLKDALLLTGFDTIPFNINDTFCYVSVRCHGNGDYGTYYGILMINNHLAGVARDSSGAEIRHDNDIYPYELRDYYHFKNGNLDSIHRELSMCRKYGYRIIKTHKKKYDILSHRW